MSDNNDRSHSALPTVDNELGEASPQREDRASHTISVLHISDNGDLAPTMEGSPPAIRIEDLSSTGVSTSRGEREGPMLPSGDALIAGGDDSKELLPGVIDADDPMMGATVAERYIVRSCLGEGGVGKVYCAEQLPLGRLVALKLLHAHSAMDEEAKARFQREAVGMTRISHPGLATVFDFGEWEGQFFIAMEILHGSSMYQWLYKNFPFTTEQIVEVMSQAAEALGAAHDAGLIHRDLKPENIMVDIDKNGRPLIKVVDWGLVVLQEGSKEERLTLEGVTVGTPHYMSPEQCQGKLVDHRTDLYALGTILYEMLTGGTPFSGDNAMALMMQQMMAQPQPPSRRNTEVEISVELEELALRSLAKDPASRVQSAEEFLAGLQRALSPSGEQEQRGQWALEDRNARADALGLPRLSDHVLHAPTAFSEYTFVVVEDAGNYQESLTMQMWANGFTVKNCQSLEQALKERDKLKPLGLVVNLCADPEPLLDEVVSHLKQGDLSQAVVVIGPDDAFELMTHALEQGIFDYVPKSQIAEKLAKSIRRTIRRHQRKSRKSRK